ncbi:MAG: hypothetical protein WDO24_21225 [Pseudomonadota bacterium]
MSFLVEVRQGERVGGAQQLVVGAERRHDRERQLLLLDDRAHDFVLRIGHDMDFARQPPRCRTCPTVSRSLRALAAKIARIASGLTPTTA